MEPTAARLRTPVPPSGNGLQTERGWLQACAADWPPRRTAPCPSRTGSPLPPPQLGGPNEPDRTCRRRDRVFLLALSSAVTIPGPKLKNVSMLLARVR